MSIGEILVIIIVVIVFVKPEDLPRFFRMIGRLYGQFERYMSKVKYYTRDTLTDLERPKTPRRIDVVHRDKTPPATIDEQKSST